MAVPTTEDKVNALGYAVAVLEGADDGYSPQDKMRHKMTLMAMLQETEQVALREMQVASDGQ